MVENGVVPELLFGSGAGGEFGLNRVHTDFL